MSTSQKSYAIIFFTFAISFSYAVLRYHIFGNVPLVELPLYVFNKALSLTIVILLLFTVVRNETLLTSKILWKNIFILSAIHVFISFRLLGLEHYPKFYFNTELNLVGYITLSFGIATFISLIILNSDNLLPTEEGKLVVPELIKKIVRNLIPIFIAGHLFSMGIMGWIKPFNWFGYMAPISLIAFVIIIIYMFIKARKN